MRYSKKSSIIASAVFGVVALAAVGGMISCGGSSSSSPYTDGSYTGKGEGRNGPIEITVTIKGGKIKACEVVKEDETSFAKPAEATIIEQVIKTQKTEGIDAVSGSTLTSQGTLAALNAALALARGEAVAETGYTDCETDIVIIGAGGAGLVAATEAANKGAKVIVVEKMGVAGGNTNSSTGGINASYTKEQERLGIKDDKETFYNDTMKGGHNINDPDLVRTLVDNSAAMVEWLQSDIVGADLSDVGLFGGATNKRIHRPQGGAAIGAHLVPLLKAAAEKQGAELRFNNKVTDIISENGKPAGVKVEADGTAYTIKAKAVIIATGGFGANPDMVVKYKPGLAGFGTTNHKGATGDAFAWIEKFDGALFQMEEIQTHPTVVPGKGSMITEAVRGNGAILVNREGKRFGNEMSPRDKMSSDILAQTGKTAFLVFDQGVRDSLKAINGYVKNGLTKQADTLADLEKELGIPSGALEATVAKYNTYIDNGNDPDFNRNPNGFKRSYKKDGVDVNDDIKLVKGPYYAIEIAPAIHHTMGGIKINPKTEVLTNSGAVVPGLYAAGEVTGGVHGGNRLGGNAVADICIFGKIAADNALAYIGK